MQETNEILSCFATFNRHLYRLRLRLCLINVCSANNNVTNNINFIRLCCYFIPWIRLQMFIVPEKKMKMFTKK